MSSLDLAAASERSDAAPARSLVFVAAFLLVIVTLRPFEDLRAAAATGPVEGNDTLTYYAFLGLALAAVGLAWRHARPGFQALARPAYFCLAGWMCFSALTSYDPSTSLKRVVLSFLVIGTAAMAPLLPRGRAEMAGLVAVAAAIPLALCYFGVLFLPDLSIHSLADTVEPDLAGDWRGVFAHKNIASPVVGFLAYIGMYLAGAGRRAEGIALAGAALVFLYFTHGKTSSALWFPAALVGYFLARSPGAITMTLALAPPLVFNALGFGAQVVPALASLAAALPIDSSFTGRTDLWRFAAEKIGERPLAGRGFDAFWDDPSLRADADEGWIAGAAHAHNGYVDAALAMGLIGLALTLWAFVAQPLLDLRACGRQGADPALAALAALAARIWVYGVWVSSLETFLYDRANPVWFLFLFAVFTLRYLATFRVAD
jgi:O-antigen ligase